MKKDNHQTLFLIPNPDLQNDFSARLLTARRQILQQALFETMGHLEIAALNQEAHEYVLKGALKTLAGRGLRAELVFALPSKRAILRPRPKGSPICGQL